MKNCSYVLMVLCVSVVMLPYQAAGQSDLSSLINKGTYFVAPNGNDSWLGQIPQPNANKTDGPMATLHAACDAVRKLPTEKPRRIVILQGKYFLGHPLELNAQASNLTIEAAPGAEVVLIGGRKVTGWKKDGEKFYSVSLAGVEEGTLDFRAFFVDGRFCKRARLPKEGFFNHLSKFQRHDEDGERRKATTEQKITMKYKPGDIGPWLDINNAEIRVYHMWDETLVGIASNDTQNHELKFSIPAGYPPGAFNVSKYIIFNIRQGMTEPGQWYLDRTEDKLVYWPLPDEQISKVEAIIPTMERIIRIQGTKDKLATDITIRGITLSVTVTPMITGGFGAGKFDGAVCMEFVKGCRLEKVEILNTSGYAIKTSESNFRVENCHLHHTGAGGIRFGGEDILITNNHIHDVGLLYPSGIGIWGGGKGNRISHNEIHDTSYTAIDCGGRDHIIEHNLFYRPMLQMRDGGAIYTYEGKNIIIRNNFARDIAAVFDDYGTCAYYLDERSENCLVENNLAINIGWPSHNHKAKNNTIRNNFFIVNRDDVETRLEFNMSSDFVFEKNVVYTTGPLIIRNREAIKIFKDNVIFSEKGPVKCHKLKEYDAIDIYPLEASQGNVLSNPLLIDYEKGIIRLAPDSPANKLGIKPIDVSSAGRR